MDWGEWDRNEVLVSHDTHLWHTLEWVVSHSGMSICELWHTLMTHTYDTHLWHTLEWVVSHVGMSCICVWVTTDTYDTHLWHTLMTHTGMSRVACRNESYLWVMTDTYDTHLWHTLMTQTGMICVACSNESYLWVMTHTGRGLYILQSHGSHVNWIEWNKNEVLVSHDTLLACHFVLIPFIIQYTCVPWVMTHS